MDISQKTSISLELEALKKEITKATEKFSDSNSGSDFDDAPEAEEIPKQNASILVTYSLLKKSRSRKMLFNYELIGRNGKDGLLQALKGEKITPGCFIVPADKENEINEFLKKHDIDFSKRMITLIN